MYQLVHPASLGIYFIILRISTLWLIKFGSYYNEGACLLAQPFKMYNSLPLAGLIRDNSLNHYCWIRHVLTVNLKKITKHDLLIQGKNSPTSKSNTRTWHNCLSQTATTIYANINVYYYKYLINILYYYY